MLKKIFIALPVFLFIAGVYCSAEMKGGKNIPLRKTDRDSASTSSKRAEKEYFPAAASPIMQPKDKSHSNGLEGRYNPDFNTENYDRIYENRFLNPKNNPLSTFSIDVDTASYSNARRFLNEGNLPPKDSVRIEEMINYFSYNYPAVKDEKPFSASTELSESPWNKKNRILLIGINGKKIAADKIPARNLVFLLDVSGSMMSENKLPLLIKSMKMLTNQLSEKDTVSIVVYAGASGLVLPPTSGFNKNKIYEALEGLEAGGSTNGGAGIELAYKVAKNNFKKNGINRVILATDGDFNVGIASQGDLIRLIEKKRDEGIFLTVLGFGSGNLKDSTMEQLADRGNGNYAYIDSISEANKVLVTQAGSTLVTIAKDVKLQVEFNPAFVKEYRLIGYENRVMKAEDFNDDKKDAGDIGAGHTVTALYEIVLTGAGENTANSVDPLKYQNTSLSPASSSKELATIKIRYKEPDGEKSSLFSRIVPMTTTEFEKASDNLRFAAGVAAFGMILRDSEFKGNSNYDMVREIAGNIKTDDVNGYRAEFLKLVEKAKSLSSEKISR